MRDTLADKVRTRRVKAQGSQLFSTPSLPSAAMMSQERSNGTQDAIEALRNDIAGGCASSMTIARSLGALRSAGMNNRDIAAALQVSSAWISRRLGLLKAPPQVRLLIESGELSENDYYRHRRSLAGKANLRRYQRIPTITISFESGRALAELLQYLATRHNASPIRLGVKPSKKEIIEILNHRALDMRRYIG